MTTTAEQFEKDRYIKIEELIPEELVETCTLYAKAMEKFNFKDGDPLAPNSHSDKDDFLMESLLVMLTPKLEQITGLSLCPTYSYYRVYKAGEKLIEHVDRPACEISVSLCLGYDYGDKDGYKWRISVNGNKIALKPGEGVIYRGTELPHSRPTLQCSQKSWHAQVFLHYVDNNGPLTDYKYDKRPGLYYKTARPTKAAVRNPIMVKGS